MTTPATDLTLPIAFVGGGNMARALLGGLTAAGVAPQALRVADPAPDLAALARLGIAAVARDNATAVRGARTVVLAVKPQVMEAACRSIAGEVAASGALVISVAAGTRLADLERWLGGRAAVVRCMPNTPALVGLGATGLVANPRVDAAGRAGAAALMASVGIVEWFEDESLMDAVTALSGSGPAYFLRLIEHLEDAAVELGLPRAAARRLAIQTGLGAMRMAADADVEPAELRRRVTSPGGTTAAALAAFDAGGLGELVRAALTAARDRGRALGGG
jgi:pyrroline-5-carboxylate reductase